MLRFCFVYLPLFLAFGQLTFGSQPNGIVLSTNGLSRIYPPFDTSGWSETQGSGTLNDHDGDDYYAQDWSTGCFSDGAKAYAGISGQAVVISGDPNYGNTLIIFDSSFNFALRYAHMQEFAPNIETGSVIVAGQYIGKVGHTPGHAPQIQPSSTCAAQGGQGAHLHLALYKNVTSMNARPIFGTVWRVTNALAGVAAASTFAAPFAYAGQVNLVKGDQRPEVYALSNNLASFVSWFVFNNQGWNFTTDQNLFQPIITIPQRSVDMLARSGSSWPPRDGTLVVGNMNPTVYLLRNGSKVGVPDYVFACRGYSFRDVNPPTTWPGNNVTLGQSEVDGYPPGASAPSLSLNDCPDYNIATGPPILTLIATCSASPNPAIAGEVVNWSSTVSGGKSPYFYHWTDGSGYLGGLDRAVTEYSSPNNYGVNLQVSDSSSPQLSTTASCNVQVNSQSPLSSTPTFSANAVAMPMAPTIGQDTALDINVTNTSGTISTVIVDAEIYSGETRLAQSTWQEGLGAGETKAVQMSWVPPTSGSYVLKLGVFKADWSQLYYWLDDALILDVLNPATAMDLQIWWPAPDRITLSGVQPFKALIVGVQPNSYTMTWQVDSGQSNAMYDVQDPSNVYADHKEAMVDLRGWKWRGGLNGVYGPFIIAFVARDLSGNVIGQKQMTLFVIN